VDLKEKGISCSQKRVVRLMKSHRIAAERKRKFVVTTDSKHDLPVAENKLNQEFTATKANEKWVTGMDLRQRRCIWVHLRVDPGRLAVSGSSSGLVFPESSRLGDGGKHGKRLGNEGFTDGSVDQKARERAAASLGQRQPVRQ
jgi:hypothetical protein